MPDAPSKTRLLLVDDHAVMRHGLAAIVNEEPDLVVAGEAEDGAEAVARARALRPDVVLMDVRMPRMDGVEATAAITREGLGRVLVLTTFDLDEYVFGALRAGAAGFLLKDAQPEVLVDAIRSVAAGKGLIDPDVTRRLIARFAEMSPDPERGRALETLSDRERDVLLLVASGRSNAEIGEVLGVEESTVKTHVSAVLAKLGLRSRVQAVILAYESGLIAPGRR
jgi:DNA-binding NarL/FixJ family response regulator